MAKQGGNNMLLEFATRNYKSLTEEVVFRMTPAAKLRDLEYSVLHFKKGNKCIKALSSAVIYGPNASGKTNLIGAMEVFKNIIMRGHIRNVDTNEGSPNIAKSRLELIPNVKNDYDQPVGFRIKFLVNNDIIEYCLELSVGKFLDTKAERKIKSEKLIINDKMIFNRNDTLDIGNINTISKHLVKAFNSKSSELMAKNNLNKQELFLTSMFKAVYSSSLTNAIVDWFENKLVIIYSANTLQTVPMFGEKLKSGSVYINETLNMVMKEFGLTGNALAYSQEEEGKEPEPLSILDIDGEKKLAIPSEIFESFGTIRFMNLFPIIFMAILDGQTVIVDEFDASIHPMALMSLINIFHNDEINKNRAQLVFNTHNPIFLNRNLFRRDEIKFVERDEETGVSKFYSLSDFGTSGSNSVRKTTDYMKNYFVNQYGAIKDVDFSEIFIKALEDGKGDETSNDNEKE